MDFTAEELFAELGKLYMTVTKLSAQLAATTAVLQAKDIATQDTEKTKA